MKKYCAVICDNRLTNQLFDTIQAHRQKLPVWWSCCHIDDNSIKTAADYNRLLTSKEFWLKFKKFSRVLIFQHDSGLLRYNIEDYLKYDFIGAPIAHMPGRMNGGLSLRNPKKMLKIVETFGYNQSRDGNEDIFFVDKLRELKGKLPSLEVAKSFSVETLFHPEPLGYHAMNKYLPEHEVRQILNNV